MRLKKNTTECIQIMRHVVIKKTDAAVALVDHFCIKQTDHVKEQARHDFKKMCILYELLNEHRTGLGAV